MRIGILLSTAGCLVGAMPAAVSAQGTDAYRCTFGELTRRVEIVRETGVSVPCEVHYYKDTESPGEHQVLWRALSEEGYCKARAVEFVQKLAEWGWDCGDADAAPTPDAAEPDDRATEQQPEEEPADPESTGR